MGQHRAVLQIVGFQDSGKTTLAEKLIEAAMKKGYRVGAIKHHGHGGVPQSNVGKDSTRHAEAGAVVAAVEGEGVVQLRWTDHTFDLAKLIALYESLLVNCIIVEGYKTALYPKVVMLKSLSDLKLMQLENVIAAIRWPEFPEVYFNDIPVFELADEQQYIEYLLREKA